MHDQIISPQTLVIELDYFSLWSWWNDIDILKENMFLLTPASVIFTKMKCDARNALALIRWVADRAGVEANYYVSVVSYNVSGS